ncbi:MAG: hypothetical protein ABI134_00805, partial [Byssovorax sp.]
GNALVANGELGELDAETDKLIFGPLRAAEKAAERRGSTTGKNAEETGAGAGDAPAASGEATPKK